jgi:hypothetical protein
MHSDQEEQSNSSDPVGRPSAEELAHCHQIYHELREIRRVLATLPMTATQALAIADEMHLEHDERAAGIRR